MTDFRMVCMDLDGTLLDPTSDITDISRQALRRLHEQGILVVIASGRRGFQVLEKLKDWGILHSVDYILGCNSAHFYDLKTKKMIYRRPMSEESLRELLHHYKGLHTLIFHHDNEVWTTWPSPLAAALAWKEGIDWKVVSRKKLLHAAVQRVMCFSTQDNIQKYLENPPEHFIQIPTGRHLLELFHPQLNKADGIRLLAGQHGISMDQVLSFGDDYNDVEMLRDTYGVAMANAKDAAKCVAKDCTLSNRENGVAFYLKKRGLI